MRKERGLMAPNLPRSNTIRPVRIHKKRNFYYQRRHRYNGGLRANGHEAADCRNVFRCNQRFSKFARPACSDLDPRLQNWKNPPDAM